MIADIDIKREIDAELVSQMREGDISAFEKIVDRYRAILIARAYARLSSMADAEDAAQEAFVQAFLHLNELRDPSALLGWLRQVTDRIALTYLRSRRETPVAASDLELLAESHTTYDRSTDAVDIDIILSQLPEAMRETISLTFLSGYTCAESAEIMGVKEGTVKSRINRARIKLKEALNVTDRDITGIQPASEFTHQTIERLKKEMRRLVASGDVDEASKIAENVLFEQVKPLYGDPGELGIAGTFLAAFDSGAFKLDEEAVSTLGLPRKEQRRREFEANAAQYGFVLKNLDWETTDVDMMSGTLGKPAGQGKDTWGVPVSRMKLHIVDTRELCQILRVSPLTLYEWVCKGCPILRCWPFRRFDVDRVEKWLADNNISDWPIADRYSLERPIRIIFRNVYDGQISVEQAEEIMQSLGYGVWEAPISELEGGW